MFKLCERIHITINQFKAKEGKIDPTVKGRKSNTYI